MALVASEFDVVSVITRADSPQGRKQVVAPTPVALAALDLGLPVIKTNSLREVDIPPADLGIVVAYGGLVPERLLSEPFHGWMNVHFSVLPEYRGAAPVQRALWDGRADTGISIFRLVHELDAGPVYFSKSIPFHATETASEALDRVAHATTDDLVATSRLVAAGALHPHEQLGQPSYAHKIAREDGRIDWTLPANVVESHIRAVTSEPGAFTTLGGVPFGIVRVAPFDHESVGAGHVEWSNDRVIAGTGDGNLELLEVKPPGKTVMWATDWWRGVRDAVTFE
jgi:methionyl-tRNA formyltransferase